MFRSVLAATAIVLLSASLAFAEVESPAESVQIGPQIGEPAPVFSALTSAGEPVDFAAISGENGATIVFSRSLDWCPYCKKQALELRGVSDALAAAGWPLSLITYDSPEMLCEFGDANDLPYLLLSDPGSAMIDAFGLRNHDMPSGSRFDGVPHPAIVFVSADGTLAALQREDGYKERPPIEGILEEVNRLNALD